MLVPDDFPREPTISSVAGSHPKVAVRFDNVSGLYAASGPSDEQVAERYGMCADLVAQLVAKCQANRETKYATLSEVQILERLLGQLNGTGWGTEAEMAWVIRHTATDLAWTIPESAAALRAMLGELG